jgi:maleate isomerase
VLAFREIFHAKRARRIGLVTPYSDAVQARIVATWAASDLTCSAERHLRLEDNFSFADVGEETVARLVREVAQEGCDAAAIVCTNMRGAGVAPGLEAELGIPVYDSIATTLWKSLRVAGVAPSRVRNWGSLFTDEALAS